jgi:hypothetical protein
MPEMNLIGLILNVLGTIAVSVSSGRWMTCVHTGLMAHGTTLETAFAGDGGIPIFVGLDESRCREMRRATLLLRYGLWAVVAGFVLQALAVLGPK